MLKFKNFKILLLLMLFAFAGQNAWGWGGDGYWMYMHIQVDSYPTGAGKVYASTSQSSAQNSNNCVSSPYITHVSTAEANINNGKTLWYINTMPVDATKWAFVGWVKNASNDYTDFYNANYISTDRNPTNGFNDPGSYASSTADGKGGKVSHSSSTYYPPDPFPITLRMTAVYRSIKPDVIAVSNNGELGATDFTDANNSVGETVVLSATPAHYNSKFEGWYKNNVLVSKENPYSFTVTNENKGTYTARFVEHKFMRIKNNTTNRYINGINDVGSITNFSSLQLESNWESTRYQAGTVVYMWDYTRTSPSAHPYVFDIQGFSSKEYYDDTGGVYVIVLHNNEADTWTISSSDKSNYMADKGASSVGMAAINAGFPLDWKFEHIDNDLETKENYFSLDPNKLVEVDGKHYTTLRTSWNILFNPDQMTPYVVTEVDEVNGTFDMEPITGNIIPAGTPVIIETKSTDIEENRMVPTKTAEASGAVPSGNQLVSSTKYFPNQSVAVANNYKKLMVNANGQLAFGGDALNQVNGNEAYLSVASEVVHDVQPVLTETTLADLLQNGKIGPNYKITDLTCVYARGNVLYCKDDNKALNKSVKADDEIDYIKEKTTFQQKDWDQSNWIAVTLPSEPGNGLLDHRLTNVVGRLKSKVNPEFEASLMPIAGEENPYDENTYITCNFWGDGHQKGVNHGEDAKMFFVVPKPMEIANVEWAMWDEEIGMFVMPSAAAGTELKGAFLPNFSMLENVSDPNPQDGGSYHFPALIKVTEESSQGKAHVLADGNSNNWTVYPLEWSVNSVITAIDGVQSGKTITRVVYYNLMGVESDKPHPGINIVETRYSDGTRTTTKIIR